MRPAAPQILGQAGLGFRHDDGAFQHQFALGLQGQGGVVARDDVGCPRRKDRVDAAELQLDRGGVKVEAGVVVVRDETDGGEPRLARPSLEVGAGKQPLVVQLDEARREAVGVRPRRDVADDGA